jgi:hypothetical protein
MARIPKNSSRLFAILAVLCVLSACKKNQTGGSSPPQRSYRMGFQNSAPRWDDFNLFLQTLNIWTSRADAAIISVEVPWDSLLNGQSIPDYVVNNYKGVGDYYRTQHFKLWVYIDPANGLDRTADAVSLVANGKSIAQPAMQQIYRRFAFVMDSILRPDHLGLALETNVIRDASPDSIYQGIRVAAVAAAADVRSFDKTVPLSISVQVDYAWGNGSGTYRGIDGDFSDFPFITELGLSSYPYFVFASPQAIPLNYYSKLTEGHPVPVFVSEGGWTSQSIPGFSGQPITSSPQTQQNYITRQGQLLDNAGAIALFQLAFTDIDLTALPPTVPATIQYFAWLGLVDANLQPRPALATWDSLFKKPLVSRH